jgi:hypothetical protein
MIKIAKASLKILNDDNPSVGSLLCQVRDFVQRSSFQAEWDRCKPQAEIRYFPPLYNALISDADKTRL